jgi:hypothetical protein
MTQATRSLLAVALAMATHLVRLYMSLNRTHTFNRSIERDGEVAVRVRTVLVM